MKETLVLFILLFCANISQTLDQEDLTNEIIENSLLLPEFSWIDPLSIQVTFPGHGKDKLNLRSFGRVADTNVPCLFNGIFENDMWGSSVVSGCINDSSVYLTIYSYHLPGKNSFIWNQAGVIDVVNPYSLSENGTENFMDDGFKDGQMEGDAEKRVKRGTLSEEYYEDEYYEEEYYEEYYEDSFDGPPPIPSDLILQVKLGYEESFLQQMNGNHSAAQEYCAEVAAHGSIHMRHSSLGTRIHLEFIGAPQFLSGKTLDVDRQSLQQVQFAKNDSLPLIVFVKKDDTNQTAMGVAWLGFKGGACDAVKSAAILKWRSNPLKAAITFAHENGHLTGQLHDEREDEKSGGKTSCEGKGIMSKGDARIERPAQCSARRFKKWFPRMGKCLVTAPSCDTGEQWKTPCTCGSGDASMVCLSSHSYCWKKYFGDSPYQCLSSEGLKKALSAPQRGDLVHGDENSALSLVMDKLLLKQAQQEKLISNLVNQLNMESNCNGKAASSNQINSNALVDPSIEERFSKQEKLMKKQEKLIENLINQHDMEINGTDGKSNEIKSKDEINQSLEQRLKNQEERLRNQEVSIATLIDQFNGTEVLSNNTNLKDIINQEKHTEDRLSNLEELSKLGIRRSCHELSQYGVTVDNFYLIDPDGPLIGSTPIRVWCTFSEDGTGTTEILHDAEEVIDVAHCHNPGCHAKPVIYSAPDSQIQSLMHLSKNCEQSIEYNCMLAPLEKEGIQFGYWLDRHGQKQVYWDGDNSGQHVCGCYFSESGCLERDLFNVTCNCNAAVPEMKSDVGTIRNMDDLPISQLQFGGLSYDIQKASHKLGRLKCSGRADFDEGTSCAAIKMAGEFRSGYFNVKKSVDVNSGLVFCKSSPGYTGDDEVFVESSESHFQSVETSIAEMEAEINVTKTDITQSETDIVKTKKDITKIKTDITGTKKDITTFKTDITGTKKDITKINTDIIETNKDITKIKTDFTGTEKDFIKMNTDITVNKKDINKIKTDIIGTKEDVTKINTDITGTKNDITKIKTDITGTKKDITKIKTDITGTKKDITKIKTDITEIKKHFTDTKADITKIKTDNTKTKSAITDIEGKVLTLEDSMVDVLRRSDYCSYQNTWVTDKRVITYDKIMLSNNNNIHGAKMDISTGEFTSGVNGIYQVAIFMRMQVTDGDNRSYLRLNDVKIPESYMYSYISKARINDVGGRYMLINLKQGDRLSIYADYIGSLHFMKIISRKIIYQCTCCRTMCSEQVQQSYIDNTICHEHCNLLCMDLQYIINLSK